MRAELGACRYPPVWLVTIGEPLPGDPGAGRAWRGSLLAKELARRGHEVRWWTSSFDHFNKRDRGVPTRPKESGENPVMEYLRGPSYERNVSVARIRNHRALARQFVMKAEERLAPAAVFCSYPPGELAAAVARYSRAHSIPYIVDVRDLWPDALSEVLPRFLRHTGTAVAKAYHAPLLKSFRSADSVVAASRSYLDWGLVHARRPMTSADGVFPLSYEPPIVRSEAVAEAWRELVVRGVRDDAKLVWFVGIFGRTYDLLTVIKAAHFLAHKDSSIQFVLSGDGEKAEEWRSAAKGCSNVCFTGHVDAAELMALRERASIGLAAYIAGAPQDLPNKVFEYLSAGLPIVSSLHSPGLRSLAKLGVARLYQPNDALGLADMLEKLLEDRAQLGRLGRMARDVFEQHYSATAVYGGLADRIAEVITEYHTRRTG